MANPKLLIIDDHDEFRKIVRDYLEKQGLGIDVLEDSSAELGIVKALREKADIVLMDIRLPGINGIDAASRIKRYLPGCDIIVLTMFETENFKKIFKSDDVIAYVGKSELYDKLVPIVKRVLAKQAGANEVNNA